MKKLKFIISRSAIILGVLLIIETLCRLYIFLTLMPVRSPAYQDSAYWSPEFDQESSSIRITFTSDNYWTLVDVHGKWVNIVNGNRVTTNQPLNYLHTIWMFGNSTLVDGSVPDNLTISSILQRKMPRYKVVNLGVNGARIHEEWARLQYANIQPGDIVIFYDGATDAIEGSQVFRDQAKRSYLCNGILEKYGWLGSVKVACDWLMFLKVPVVPLDVAHYQSIVAVAKQYTESKGSRFYHFLNPYLWSIPPIGYEITLHSPEQLDDAGQFNWPKLQAISGTIDLTHLLDKTRQAGTPIYLDGWHINEIGNTIVAQAIYQAINLPLF